MFRLCVYLLLANRQTIIGVYPKGHGEEAIVMKKSFDGGITWTDRLKVPGNWKTSKEVPTLHRVTDNRGVERIIMFSGLYPIRMAISEDDGLSWSQLEPIGKYGGVVAMSDVICLKNGNYMAFFMTMDGSSIRQTKSPILISKFFKRFQSTAL